jgi:capsular polysaccharide biosynthesis protein
MLVQTNDPSIKPFVYDMASALEIDESRIIHHDRPIIAETVFTATFRSGMYTDWSCLHGALKNDNDRTIALVYQRPGIDPKRDISPDIHSELVNELSVALGIPVKTFNGTGSLDEARELFSSAKIVIGPHGAGLANLIFVSSHWVPVIEYITPDLLNRPWQLYGGGSFGLPWFPVLLSSFQNRDEIMKSVHVAKEALLIAEERSGNFP